ncbi:MAG: hypothetical protein K6E41_04790 [Solobacterium sp.]|jgi:hypothetical protein|nr:hypothetical protein [Solobacterium sp.]
MNGRVISAWCLAIGAVGMAVCVIFFQPRYGLISICLGALLAVLTRAVFRK